MRKSGVASTYLPSSVSTLTVNTVTRPPSRPVLPRLPKIRLNFLDQPHCPLDEHFVGAATTPLIKRDYPTCHLLEPSAKSIKSSMLRPQQLGSIVAGSKWGLECFARIFSAVKLRGIAMHGGCGHDVRLTPLPTGHPWQVCWEPNGTGTWYPTVTLPSVKQVGGVVTHVHCTGVMTEYLPTIQYGTVLAPGRKPVLPRVG